MCHLLHLSLFFPPWWWWWLAAISSSSLPWLYFPFFLFFCQRLNNKPKRVETDRISPSVVISSINTFVVPFLIYLPEWKKGKKKYAENGIQDREDVGNDNNNRQSHSSIRERAMKREQMKDFTHLILYLIVLCCVLFRMLIYSRSRIIICFEKLKKKKRSLNFFECVECRL